MKGAGLQAGLGDTLEHRIAGRRLAAVVDRPTVQLLELLAIDLLAHQESGIAGGGDLDLLQHLANDHLDVLVVDLHALEPIDALDLIGEILGQGLDAEGIEDIVRHRVAVHQEIADQDVVALLDRNVLALGDHELPGLRPILLGHHDDPALGLVVLAELDPASVSVMMA